MSVLSNLEPKSVMYYFEELSYKKMQKIMGVPLNTIKTALRRAKLSLAKKINNEKRGTDK